MATIYRISPVPGLRLERGSIYNHPVADRIWVYIWNILGFFQRSYSIYSRMAVDATPPLGLKKNQFLRALFLLVMP